MVRSSKFPVKEHANKAVKARTPASPAHTRLLLTCGPQVRPHVRADHPAPCADHTQESERTGVSSGNQSPLSVALW
jgi:hypothetical protein